MEETSATSRRVSSRSSPSTLLGLLCLLSTAPETKIAQCFQYTRPSTGRRTTRVTIGRRTPHFLTTAGQFRLRSPLPNNGNVVSMPSTKIKPFWNSNDEDTTNEKITTKESGPEIFFSNLFGLKNEEEEVALVETETEENEMVNVGAVVLATIVAVGGAFLSQNPEVLSTIEQFFADPTSVLESAYITIQAMGNKGILYFFLFYTLAEISGIPATPLTASAGYLFGVKLGSCVVLLSASISASIAFLLGRTLFRDKVEGLLDTFPKFRALDKAIGNQGFKVMLLLRLSPIFPFSLSSYVYGVTSIKFWPYFWGTTLGFLPGTVAYVYAGYVGKALTLDASAEPWYFYAGVLAVVTVFLKIVADVATEFIESVEESN